MLYLLGKMWEKIKIVIGLLVASWIASPLIVGIKMHIRVVETYFWIEICGIPPITEIIGKVKEEEEEEYEKALKEWKEKYKDILVETNWKKRIIGGVMGTLMESSWGGIRREVIEKMMEEKGVTAYLKSENLPKHLREIEITAEQFKWLSWVERVIYGLIINTIVKVALVEITPWINKIILYFGYEKYIYFSEEVGEEKIIKMQQEYPQRLSFEMIEKIALERYETLKEIAWKYFIENLTAEYWSALIENFDLFI